jgi:hypothetical protein
VAEGRRFLEQVDSAWHVILEELMVAVAKKILSRQPRISTQLPLVAQQAPPRGDDEDDGQLAAIPLRDDADEDDDEDDDMFGHVEPGVGTCTDRVAEAPPRRVSEDLGDDELKAPLGNMEHYNAVAFMRSCATHRGRGEQGAWSRLQRSG